MKKKKFLYGLALTLGLSFTVFAFAESAHAADMHRLYNPNSGEHFYTANGNEKNHLTKVGWKYEGLGWTAPASGAPVYRLYNANAGDHHYTLNAGEKNNLVKVGWKYEGIGWYSDTKKAVPLYRAYNPNAKAGSHNYTVNYGEQQNLLKHGWRNEGIAWYGVKKTTPAPTPVQKFTIKVEHKGSDGKLLKSSSTSIEKGKKYTANSASFSGYTLKGNKSQTITVSKNQTITFSYTKNSTPVVTKYNVTVVHKGTDKVLETEKAVAIEKGKKFTAKAKKFNGYYDSTTPSQTITVTKNETITFTYYKKTTYDKSKLQALYDKVKNTAKGNYTEATWSEFQKNLTTTKNVLENESSTQATIDYTLSNLQTAFDNLKEKTPAKVDKTTLINYYNDLIKNTVLADYSHDSIVKFNQSTSSIKINIIDSSTATQAQVDQALTTLKNLKTNMVNIKNLKSKVDAVKNIQKGNYTDTSWNTFKTALAEAQEILAEKRVDLPTQAQVDLALTKLSNAHSALKENTKPTTDKSGLQRLVNENKDKDLTKYTQGSLDEFVGNLNHAKEVLSRDDATQKEIDDAEYKLWIAVSNLVDISELKKLYNSVKDTDLTNYWANTVKTFKTSLEKAKQVLEDRSSKQSEVDKAQINLESAFNNLIIEAFSITINCVDENDKLIGQSNYSADKGTYYEAKALDLSFNGYELNDEPVKKIFVDGNKTVTFKYKKKVNETEKIIELQKKVNTEAIKQWGTYRGANGKTQAYENDILQKMADQRAKELVEIYDANHTRPSGYDVFGYNEKTGQWGESLAEEFGYYNVENMGVKRTVVGENIAKIEGVSLEWIQEHGATYVMEAWKASPAHNNMLLVSSANNPINQYGIGSHITKNADGTYNVYYVALVGYDKNLK